MTRDELIAFMRSTADEKPTKVEVKGWGVVYVRSLTVAEVQEQTDDTADKKDKNLLARGVARLLCDEKGKRLFDPDNAEDVKLLASQPWKLLRPILAASEDTLDPK